VPLIDGMSRISRLGGCSIVGPTGAGKTTLVNLLCGSMTSTAVPFAWTAWTPVSSSAGRLRRMFGHGAAGHVAVLGTIRENIAYGRESASEEAIVNARGGGRRNHFIRRSRQLPNADQRGASNLSAGAEAAADDARAFLAIRRSILRRSHQQRRHAH